MMFRHAKWIWLQKKAENDEYAEFVDAFEYHSGKVVLKISADSNYACYVNGELAACGQYGDFPHYKIHDEIDVTSYCKQGRNCLAIIVWYYGIDTSITYYPGEAALIYQLENENQILCYSSQNTRSRMSRTYQNHVGKSITTQLGLTFCYDSAQEDGWMTEFHPGFQESRLVEQTIETKLRPCRVPVLSEKVSSYLVEEGKDYMLFDMQKEVVGLLCLKLWSKTRQKITICYAEHLTDGRVKNIIDDRDFSVTYIASEGDNVYMNPFRRLGCRYLEVRFSDAIRVEYMTLAPRIYHSEKKPAPKLAGKRKKLYDLSVNTLELCRNEHYEDCPWREQGLYGLDSRNQMLFGYYVFEGYEYARANLVLIANDNREDGLLTMTAPSVFHLCIPSFSLHFIIAVAEYIEHSKDTSIAGEVLPKIKTITERFLAMMEDGLVVSVPKEGYWHFYEWVSGLDGTVQNGQSSTNGNKYDLILNCLFSMALDKYIYIAKEGAMILSDEIQNLRNQVNTAINRTFYDDKKGLYFNGDNARDGFSELGNALAILCGAAGNKAHDICQKLVNDDEMASATPSMLGFKYDALIHCDKEKYRDYILVDIDSKFDKMLNSGTTTLWETFDLTFGDAESLCHGWSAIAAYYFQIL